MAYKHIYMAVDRTFRDITKCDKPFGNKIMLLGGDFRQILPVTKNGNRSQIVNSTIKKTTFWKFFKQFQLTENMRIKSAARNQGKPTHLLNEFSDYLLKVEEGLITPFNNSKYIDEIELNANICKNIDESELIELIYTEII